MDAAHPEGNHLDIEVRPVVVLSRTFPARPSAIPDIRDFIKRTLADSPLPEEGSRNLFDAVSQALLGAAGPEGTIQIAFRIFPHGVEVDVLRGVGALGGALPLRWPEETSFASWMSAVLKREGLTQEAAARELGVSVRTIGRWVRGDTRPRLRELRRILEVFGEVPPA